MKLREGTGSLTCRICDASFQMPIHHLHEPVDVFSEWLDACEAAEKGTSGSAVGNGEDDGAAGGRKSGDEPGGGVEKAAYANLGLDDSDDDSD